MWRPYQLRVADRRASPPIRFPVISVCSRLLLIPQVYFAHTNALAFLDCKRRVQVLPDRVLAVARYYSQRRAIIGSTLEARRAGIAHANPDTKPRRIVPAKRITGSRGFPWAHFATIWPRASERVTPAKIPAPRLSNADLNTIRNKSPRCAPSAVRIP